MLPADDDDDSGAGIGRSPFRYSICDSAVPPHTIPRNTTRLPQIHSNSVSSSVFAKLHSTQFQTQAHTHR